MAYLLGNRGENNTVTKNQRAVYHVTPEPSSTTWLVSRENSRFRCEFDRKAEAVRFAKRAAHQHEFGQIKIHGPVGGVRQLTTNVRRIIESALRKIKNITFVRKLYPEGNNLPG